MNLNEKNLSYIGFDSEKNLISSDDCKLDEKIIKILVIEINKI